MPPLARRIMGVVRGRRRAVQHRIQMVPSGDREQAFVPFLEKFFTAILTLTGANFGAWPLDEEQD